MENTSPPRPEEKGRKLALSISPSLSFTSVAASVPNVLKAQLALVAQGRGGALWGTAAPAPCLGHWLHSGCLCYGGPSTKERCVWLGVIRQAGSWGGWAGDICRVSGGTRPGWVPDGFKDPKNQSRLVRSVWRVAVRVIVTLQHLQTLPARLCFVQVGSAPLCPGVVDGEGRRGAGNWVVTRLLLRRKPILEKGAGLSESGEPQTRASATRE